MSQPRDSLKQRYVYKVVSSLVGVFSNLVVQSIAPRSLGPEAFGNFNFVTNFFDQVFEAVDGRSSVGLLVKVSLRPQERALVAFYLVFTVGASLAVMGLTGGLWLLGLHEWVWPGQTGSLVLLGALWSSLVWLHANLHKVCDAHGLTRQAEWVRVQQKVLSVVLILALYLWSQITIDVFMTYYLVVLAYLVVGFSVILWRHNLFPQVKDWLESLRLVKPYASEFYVYASPLFVYVLMESVVAVVDRWVLQTFAGSQEQGYFGLAYQLGYISVLFVGAISPLIQRELSIAHAENNRAHMGYLFERYMPMLFSLAAYFTGFVAFHSGSLTRFIAGQGFSESSSVMAILAFYPIYLTYGRVVSSVFYATGENRLFRNIGLIVQTLGLVLSWILIAPQGFHGLEMGADGLALKMVMVQAVLVNVQLFFATRILHLKYRASLAHQGLSLAVFLGLGYFSWWLSLGDSDLTRVLFGGVIYSLAALVAVIVSPKAFGIERSDLRKLWGR